MYSTEERGPNPKPRSVNWIGLWTLYVRDVRRFLAVAAHSPFEKSPGAR